MRRQRKMTAHSCCLSLSALSHLNEQSLSFFFFSCGHPHKYFNLHLSLSLSLSLSSYSVSWSSRPASQAKTWTSCAVASARVPRPPLQTPTQNAASSLSTASLCLCNRDFGGFTPLPVCIAVILFLWVKDKANFQSSRWSNQPSASGINTRQFRRLLLAKYPPCG